MRILEPFYFTSFQTDLHAEGKGERFERDAKSESECGREEKTAGKAAWIRIGEEEGGCGSSRRE